jgi:fumarate reductase subunit C
MDWWSSHNCFEVEQFCVEVVCLFVCLFVWLLVMFLYCLYTKPKQTAVISFMQHKKLTTAVFCFM